jgi:hypothetical protein
LFVSDYLGVNSQQLFQAIKANETTYGSWMATVSQDLMNALNLQVAYVGTLETEESHCHPLLKSRARQELVGPTRTKYAIVGSLVLQLLFNTKLEFKLYWTRLQLFILSRKPLKELFWLVYLSGWVLYLGEAIPGINCMMMLPFDIGSYHSKAEMEQQEMLH